MSFPIKVELAKNGYVFETRVAESSKELIFHIDMLTGVGKLDTLPLYEKMLQAGCAEMSQTLRVCHSFEKWGGWQQETVNISVRMMRVVGRAT